MCIATTFNRSATTRVFPALRIKQEEGVALEPTSSDIICTRGKAYRNHEGNIVFANAMRANVEKFREASNRLFRSRVVTNVHKEILASGARFLAKKNGVFYELSEMESRQKVGHALRDLIRHGKKGSVAKSKAAKQEMLFQEQTKKRKSILALHESVRPAPDTRGKTFDTILAMAVDIAESIDSDMKKTSTKDADATPMETLSLNNEAPEEGFVCSVESLFGDYGDDYDSEAVDKLLMESTFELA